MKNKMKDGHLYLIKIRQEKNYYTLKLAYWFDERTTDRHTYKPGFYRTKHYIFPYKHVVDHIDFDKVPTFDKWKKNNPVEGKRYLVYRVGKTKWCSPHYTIRKYHNNSFRSADVKYWIELNEVCSAFEPTEKQINQVNRRIDHFGQEKVQNYINKFFKEVDINNLTRKQAQKIITGMDLPVRPILGVYGRDFGKQLIFD